MAYLGAFRLLINGDYTHVKVTRGGRNQTTGAREDTTRVEQVIPGALDPMTEEDLKLFGIAQFKEGSFKFFCQESHGVENGDLIIDDRGRKFRVVQLINTAPLVRKVMGHAADPIGFMLELTKEGRVTP